MWLNNRLFLRVIFGPVLGQSFRLLPVILSVGAWTLLIAALWLLPGRIFSSMESVVSCGHSQVALPWYGGDASCHHEFHRRVSFLPESLWIRADDCVERLEVDGNIVFAATPAECLHCAYTEFPLPKGLSEGPHLITIVVNNLKGEAWLDVKEAHGLTTAEFLFLGAWGIGCFLAIGRFGYASWVAWPIALAGLLALQYLDVSTPWVRQHDVEGHREYITHLRADGDLPGVKQGWETWQPPLYYIMAAVWQAVVPSPAAHDPFRSVQYLSALLYVGALVLTLLASRRLGLSNMEACFALSCLAFLPGILFFSGRINNDVLLPLLGGAVMWLATEYARKPEPKWLLWLSVVLALSLATKGSSLALLGGACCVIFWVSWRRSGFRSGVVRAYLVAIPSLLWLLFWWSRNIAQTGEALYVNAALPEHFRILAPVWHRMLSFDFGAFLQGGYYYDPEMRNSYPTALVTSILYGEYGMQDYGLRWSWLLRLGMLGLLIIMAVGVIVPPRPEVRPLWAVCLCLAGFQTAISVAYAVQFPYSCNQNMRFFAQVFVPVAVLWGMGAWQFWHRWGREDRTRAVRWGHRCPTFASRMVLVAVCTVFALGLGEFYYRLFF